MAVHLLPSITLRYACLQWQLKRGNPEQGSEEGVKHFETTVLKT